MISPLLDTCVQYGGSVGVGIAVALVSRLLIVRQTQSKMYDYQGQIVKSHSRILSLEAENDQLEKKIKELEHHSTDSAVLAH